MGRIQVIIPGLVLATLVTLGPAAAQRGAPNGNMTGLDDPPGTPRAATPAARAKADHQQNIQDATRLAQLAAEVKQELETGGESVLSMTSLKKADEMEKLAKRLHSRMKQDYSPAPQTPPMSDASQGAIKR